MNDHYSIYGSAICPNCQKRHYAVLRLSEPAIPPPAISIGCQCSQPPVSVELVYTGSESVVKPHPNAKQ